MIYQHTILGERIVSRNGLPRGVLPSGILKIEKYCPWLDVQLGATSLVPHPFLHRYMVRVCFCLFCFQNDCHFTIFHLVRIFVNRTATHLNAQKKSRDFRRFYPSKREISYYRNPIHFVASKLVFLSPNPILMYNGGGWGSQSAIGIFTFFRISAVHQ